MAKASDRKPNAPAASALRDQVHAFKREQILREAAELFYEIGYHATTLEAVAERLGVTKPFIYYHFKSKAEILFEICRPAINDVNLALDEALNSEGSTAARLQKAIAAVTHTVLDHQRYTTIFFREEKNFSPDAKEALNQLRKSYDAKFRALLEEGVSKGEFKIDDSRFCSQAISGMINWAFFWFNPQGRSTKAQVGEQMAALVLQMVGAVDQAASPRQLPR